MKQVNLSLETATKMYNSGDESLKAFALENYPELKPLPTKWEDLLTVRGCWVNPCTAIINAYSEATLMHRNVFYSFEQALASIALAQLSQLKAAYNDGWEPDWKDSQSIKFCIHFNSDVPTITVVYCNQAFLTFKTNELAEKFLKNFRDLIMEAKPLL